MKNIITIGITGYVGSGKTLACELIEKKFKCNVIYTDNVAKDIINNDDRFIYLRDRKGDILSDIEIEKVKNELHPIVWQNVKDMIDTKKDKIDFILVETALPSKSFFELCDMTILVQNDIDKKANLLKEKRDYNDNIIDAILRSQLYYKDNYTKCDYVIDNNTTKEDLEKNVLNIINNIKDSYAFY